MRNKFGQVRALVLYVVLSALQPLDAASRQARCRFRTVSLTNANFSVCSPPSRSPQWRLAFPPNVRHSRPPTTPALTRGLKAISSLQFLPCNLLTVQPMQRPKRRSMSGNAERFGRNTRPVSMFVVFLFLHSKAYSTDEDSTLRKPSRIAD